MHVLVTRACAKFLVTLKSVAVLTNSFMFHELCFIQRTLQNLSKTQLQSQQCLLQDFFDLGLFLDLIGSRLYN